MFIAQERINEIRLQRAFAKQLGGETMPTEKAIDDLLSYIEMLERDLDAAEKYIQTGNEK